MHQKPFVGRATPDPLGELTALPQTFKLDRGREPRNRKGTHREEREREEGEVKEGRETKYDTGTSFFPLPAMSKATEYINFGADT